MGPWTNSYFENEIQPQIKDYFQPEMLPRWQKIFYMYLMVNLILKLTYFGFKCSIVRIWDKNSVVSCKQKIKVVDFWVPST